MYKKIKALDDTRFVDTASGWFSGVESDLESLHIYFKPVKIKDNCEKPVFLSEFGGYSYRTEGHVFNNDNEYGYKSFKTREEFEDAFISLYENEIIPAIKKGLCGTVYTQVSDVEDEINGLLTYDRKMLKVNEGRTAKMSEKLFEAFAELTRE
jgi:hypothetical protein